MTDPLTTHPAAFLSAAASFAARHQEDLPPSFWDDLKAAWTTDSQKYKLGNPLLDQLLLALATGEGKPLLYPRWTKQHEWHSIISTQMERDWESTACLRLRKIRELSIARKPADVLSSPFSEEGREIFPSRGWTLLVKYRLNLPLCSAETATCPGCRQPMDRLGDHALSCHSLGLCSRHNALRNEFATLCKEAGLKVELEVQVANQGRRPADTRVSGLFESGPVYIDFGVIHFAL